MSDKRDFFISFIWADVQIATAINDALNEAGFTTWFHPADKPKGAGIADWMEVALDASNQMLAICSDAYFDREKGYSRAERQSMFWEDPTNNRPLLILVKVAECRFPRLIAQNEYISLTGLQRPEAAAKLVEELRSEQARVARVKAAEVGRSRARPAHFNVQGSKNPLFTGRDTELALLHHQVTSGNATAITAVQGMGGIGKSSLAREYAHRFGTAARFGGVWWIDAETRSGILAAYDRLAEELGDLVSRHADQERTGEAVRDWLGRQPDTAPWLVVFDNAPDDVTVAPWLPKGSAKVIITSRHEGFCTIAHLLSLHLWTKATTAEFLRLRTGRGTDAEALSLADRLDGLPLAAEQAGAYLSENATLSFRAYEERLIEMLSRAPKVLPGGYDKSLYATFRAAIEAIRDRPHGDAALGILNLCAFLSPDGVELDLITASAVQSDVLPDPPRGALADEVRRAEAVASLSAYSMIRVGEAQKWGRTLILHRLLGDIARDLMDREAHALWSGAAVGMIVGLMPKDIGNKPSLSPLLARLIPHARAMLPLEPESATTGKALSELLNEAALYLDARGDADGSILFSRRAVQISEAFNNDDPNQFAIAFCNLAGLLQDSEETRGEAEAAYARALEIQNAILSPDDVSLAITKLNLGGLRSLQKEFASAAELIGLGADIMKAAHGKLSAEYASAIGSLGSVYCDWAQATGNADLRRRECEAKEEADRIMRALHGMRHPAMTVGQNNLAFMHANTGDMHRAAEHMGLAVAIDLSLDQIAHPATQKCLALLVQFWADSDQIDKATRLAADNISDLIPFVERIEAEHRAWVAEDPDNRKFGPPSPITGATA